MTTEEDDEEDDEDDEDIAAPISPRGAPDGRVEIEHNEQAADSNAVAARIMRPSLSSRPGSLGGGRTETEDDEDSSSDEDDRSDVSDIEIREEEQVRWRISEYAAVFKKMALPSSMTTNKLLLK